MNPRINRVVPIDGYKLKLFFTNGEQGIYDCSSLLDFGVFKELRNNNYFNKAYVLDGTVAWPNEQDICPDTLYLDSAKLSAVKQNRSCFKETTMKKALQLSSYKEKGGFETAGI